MSIEPWKQRVHEEKFELDQKLDALTAFIRGPNFGMVDGLEQQRMLRQRQYMIGYSDVLGERIAAFSEQSKGE